MSHHFDSPLSRDDGRLDLTDLFVFPGGEPHRTVLVLAVNPDAGLSSPMTFRSDARYVFNVDTDGDLVEEVGFEARFGEPPTGQDAQPVTLFSTDRPEVSLASGRTGEAIAVAGGGRLWAGLAADPFLADAVALAQFQEAVLVEGRFDLAVFGAHPTDFASGRNVTAIVLEVPDDSFGTTRIGVWTTVEVRNDGRWTQVNRAGRPMIHPLFTVVDERLADGYNSTRPRDDLANYGEAFTAVVRSVLQASGGAVPIGHADKVVRMFLPDVLTYELGKPANFAAGNGRALTDDVFAHMVGTLVGTPIRHGLAPRPAPGDFPYLAPANQTSGRAPIMLRDAEGRPQLNPAAMMPAQG